VRLEHVLGGLASTGAVDARLSERQREALAAGLELGYYETPREASQEDVADSLGCAPSTAAEHLQKAEATLARSALGQ
jgi:predicted DNA binding protein